MKEHAQGLTGVIHCFSYSKEMAMEYVKMGYKVIKKNYLTIEGRRFEAKKGWKSPLDGKTYDIPAKTRILVRVGDGFKNFIENKKMPEKLCRFVNSSGEEITV
jgi:hypothetical protein